MEQLAVIGTVTIIHLLAVMSPGPDLVVAVKNSLSYSRKTGIWTSVGFGLGILVHIIYCLAGLALVISQSIIVFTIIKMLGAGYLIYIGVQSIRSRSSKVEVEVEKREDISPIQAISIGFWTNVLNPKATLFFLSLFTFVLSPQTPIEVMLAVSIIMVMDTMLWFSLVAVFFTQPKVRSLFTAYQGVFNKLFGGILVTLGITVAVSQG